MTSELRLPTCTTAGAEKEIAMDDAASGNINNNMVWYYQKDSQQAGPIDLAEIEKLIAHGQIDLNTKVWQEGMLDWQPAKKTALLDKFSRAGEPPVAPPPIAQQATPLDDIRRLNRWFMIFWICLAAGIPLSFVIIGLAAIIASVVFYCLILHKCWSLIPADIAKTTPGKAVGYLFIPFFNLYWNFVAYYGLAQAINIETRRNSISGQEVNEGLCLAYCIMICCTWIPYLGVLASIAAVIIWIISLKQIKDAAIALLSS